MRYKTLFVHKEPFRHLLQFPLLLQLKSMELKHVGGKQISIKVSQCVFSGRICFTLQLTLLAVRAWITRTTAVFPPDSGPPLKQRTHLVVSLWARDWRINHLNYFFNAAHHCLLMQALAQSVCVLSSHILRQILKKTKCISLTFV